jgi:hypothetical protein
MLGFGLGTVLGQPKAGSGPGALKLPPDVVPSSLARIPYPSKGDCCPLNTDEEKQAFEKEFNYTAESPNKAASMGTHGMRLYFPIYGHMYFQAHQWLDKEGKLDPRYVALAQCVGTREAGSGGQREWFIHEAEARKVGISEEELDVIRTQKDTKGLPETDAVILQFGREMMRGPKVSSKTFAEAERLLGRRGLLVVTFQIARYAANALTNRAYDVQLEPGQVNPW